MKILLLCGSPTPKNSTSLLLLNEIKRQIGPAHKVRLIETHEGATGEAAACVTQALVDCDALVLAYSLYVDSVPARLLSILKAIEECRPWSSRRPRVYQVINCGFYEPRQNDIAMEILWNWCRACGLRQGAALAMGGGPLLKGFPLGKGPCTDFGNALRELAGRICRGEAGGTRYTKLTMPRLWYLWGGNLNWRHMLHKQGLSVRDSWRRQEPMV